MREANIQITCHNLQQFKIIETLFLRLKFSVLLEYGHSTYYDSTDKNNPVLVPNNKNLSNWFLQPHSQREILDKIEEYRKDSFGNYDAFFGFVKNFSWTLKPDGGYEITVSLISMGDVIESLKINSAHPTGNTNLNVDPNLEYTPAYYAQKDRSTLNKILYGITAGLVGSGFAHGYEGGAGSYTALHTGNLVNIGGLKGYNYRKDEPVNKPGPYLQDNEGYFYLFPYLSNGEGGAQGEIGRQYYIKLGTLLRIIEGFLMYYNTDRQDKEPIVYIDYNFNNNYCLTLPRQVSTDPTVCLIPLDSTLLASSTTTPPATTGAVTTPTPTVPTPPAPQPAIRVETEYWAYVVKFIKGMYIVVGGAGIDEKWYYFSNATSTYQEGFKNENPGVFDQLVGKGTEVRTQFNADEFSKVKIDHIEEYYLPISDILNDFAAGTGLSNSAIEITNNTKQYNWAQNVTPQPNTKYVTAISYYDTIDEEKKFFPTYLSVAQVSGKLKVTITEFITADATIVASAVAPEVISSKNVLLNFDKGYRKAGGWKGRHMHIHLNVDYIARTLQDNIETETGKLSLYNFLTKLMHGVQNAMGNINNFEVIYNEPKNELRIIDNTIIPGLNGRNTLTQINANILKPNNGSFVYDINVKTELSKAFATMVTVGAQANGNVVGEDATAFSRWNRGLRDRHFPVKQNVNSPKKSASSTTATAAATPTLPKNITTSNLFNIPQVDITAVASTTATNYNNINQQTQVVSQQIAEEKEAERIANQQVTPEESYDLKIAILKLYLQRVNDGTVSDGDVEQLSQSIQDLLKLDLGQLTNKGKIPGIGFIPFNLQLTLDGLSGPKIYQTYTIDTSLLPENYNKKIQFITKGVSHKIDSSGWTTILDSLTSPKYRDFKVTDPPSVTWGVTETVVVNRNSGGGGGPLGGTDQDGTGTEATLVQGVKYHSSTQTFYDDKTKRTYNYGNKLYKPRGGDPTAIVLHYNAGWARDTTSTFYTMEKRSNIKPYPIMTHFGVDRAGNYDQYIPWSGWGNHACNDKLSTWGIGYEIGSTGPLEAIDANTVKTLNNNFSLEKYRRNLGKTADEPIGWPTGKIPTTAYDYQTQCVDFAGNPLDKWRGSKYWCRFTTKEIDTVKKLIQEHSKKFNIPINFKSQADWDRCFKDDKQWIKNQTANLPAKPSGIYTHSSVTWTDEYKNLVWKTDINPDPDLIAMLKSISQ